jgi:hypothetical protein
VTVNEARRGWHRLRMTMRLGASTVAADSVLFYTVQGAAFSAGGY